MPGLNPAVESRVEWKAARGAGDWLCAWCYNGVASDADRFQMEGKSEFTFDNPQGVRFEIILFTETHNCRQTGPSTVEHTWFAEHAWSFCHCAECGQQLGWYFEGPHAFAGLVRARLIRGIYVRN